MKTMIKLSALLALVVATFGQYTTASAVAGPVYEYPTDGQTLDYEGSYLFKVQPIASAEGFLWGFFQNGVMVWENYRDEGTLSGNEYGIHPGSVAHSKFVPGDVEVWVRAAIEGEWTDATVITIRLQPRGTSIVTVTVPGAGNLWLAGMPDGTPSLFGDSAPANSPAQVLGLTITPGVSLSFSATGQVSHGPPSDPLIQTSGPDGGTNILSHDYGPENGISDIQAPINALLGVFLGPNQPDQSAPPSALDFSTAASQDYLSLAPQLQQVFFIGDGLTSVGQIQEIVIPASATRLFLGPMDASQYNNNEGSFTVQVSNDQAAEVIIDVKPGRFPNRIALEKHVCKDDDNLYVAILTTLAFDAATVNASSLQIGDPLLRGRASPSRSRITDVDLDGDMDMALAFPLCKLVNRNALKTSTTELVLIGMTSDGNSFTARDSVKVVRDN